MWTIHLRKGVTFHNGQEMTADDVIFTIKRIINPKAPGEAANAFRKLDVSGLKKVDKYTVTVPFTSP